MNDGFKIPRGTIPKGFPGERGVVLQPWEVYGLIEASRRARASDIEHHFPTRFVLIRPMEPQPDNPPGYFCDGGGFMKGSGGSYVGGSIIGGNYPKEQWLYRRWQHLWVRETWQIIEWQRDYESGHLEDFNVAHYAKWDRDTNLWIKQPLPKYPVCYGGPFQSGHDMSVVYRASHEDDDMFSEAEYMVWRPSTTMPRWASRFDLKVITTEARRLSDVRVGDIGDTWVGYDKQANFDGDFRDHILLTKDFKGYRAKNALEDFKLYWDRQYAEKGLGVATDPWVYVIMTRVITPQEYLFYELNRLRSELRKAGAHKPKEEVAHGNV